MTELPAEVDLTAEELVGRIKGDTLTVTINRPEKRNALTADGYHGIKRAAMIVADEPALSFLVITGTGETFCAGGDMNAVGNDDRRWDSFTDAYDVTPFETLGKIPKIVVCAVNGTALGGGLVMSLYSDLVIASDRARFRVPDLTRGVYEAFIAARIPQRIGTLRANHLIYGNDWIDAAEAERLGLVGRVVAHEALAAETEALLDRVRQTGPTARAAMKREMARALPAVDVAGYWSSMGTQEQIEAFTAFLRKRPPQWSVNSERDAFVHTRRPAWMPPASISEGNENR
ncbi:putative enoyl-CoA hydratase echA8 [Mycolicibacterium vanbaalenii]|uniref:Putative enoyl-CoA hydratase echA8 n=1 Tax=Mycolicibacterium vanbaalenii TaxID=110539 RepID=A0A5S9MRS0_MYCVN|nr:enoyl-CoA hydratase/isomerase family protein [Mycolicibacterium vanbaalenii]CAA0079258.1 putative enoyl-CoA hydratase echA8 [Mycolicibacterium vanbaalenii]